MKKNYLFLSLVAMIFAAKFASAQTIFVKNNASGSNDGSSWANAFTTLDAAIVAAQPGQEIWIAGAGDYKPAQLSPAGKSTFRIKKAITVRGGFAGTETNPVQRAIGSTTNLSGDLGGNDLPDDFITNSSDNCWHVFTIDSVVGSGPVRLDRLTIKSARADSTTAASSGINGRGGAIQARAQIEVTDCHFTQNWARSGAAIWLANNNLTGPANNSSVKNSTFYSNSATEQSHGIHARYIDGLTLDGCQFLQNTGNRGGFYPFDCLDVDVKNCVFSQNFNPTGFGGAAFIWASNVAFSKTKFELNEAGNAGAIYNDGRDNLGTSVTFDSCTFSENKATGTSAFGGAVYNYQATASFSNCLFEKNLSRNVGAVYSDGRDNIGSLVNFNNCIFDENKADNSTGGAIYFWKCPGGVLDSKFTNNSANSGTGGWGGAAAVYGLGSDVHFARCAFENNTALRSGGAITTAFLARLITEDCVFDGNMADFGGAIFAQNDSTEVTIVQSAFTGNTATNSGGAINLSAGIPLQITGSTFDVNTANFGGAIQFTEDSLDLAVGNISECSFYLNTALTQAGAINLGNVDLSVTNCLFNSNFATDGASGGNAGCISNNASDGKTANLALTHCTFGNNLAATGAALAQWEDEFAPGSEATTVVTNCIFADALNSYFLEAGTPTLTSNGGNLSLDNSFSPDFNGTNDVENADPLFKNPDQDDFHLAAGSPCIDKGVTGTGVNFDLEGLPRDSKPDKGCYEYGAVSTGQPLVFQSFSMTPNPTSGPTDLVLKSEETGTFRIVLMDAKGQVLSTEMVEKTAETLTKRLELGKFPQGVYLISLEKDGRRAGRAVVKN